MNFKINDKIIVTEPFQQHDVSFNKGDKGIVKIIKKNPELLKIEWTNKSSEYFHTCNGHCKKYKGYNIYSSNIKNLKKQNSNGVNEKIPKNLYISLEDEFEDEDL